MPSRICVPRWSTADGTTCGGAINQGTRYADAVLLFTSEPALPAAVRVSQGHGRLEPREVRVFAAIGGSSALPELAQVAEVTTQVARLATDQTSTTTRYLVTSLSPARAAPSPLLALSRGHWGIEHRLFHIHDDTFGENRQVLQTHAAGTVLSLLRATVTNLLRGRCALWTTKTPLTARAEWRNGHPAVGLAALAEL